MASIATKKTALPKVNFIKKTAPTLTKALLAHYLKHAKSGEFVEDNMIGPELAALLLEKHNPVNRSLNKVHVNSLARDMAEGRWKGHVGDEMTIDRNGHLNNCQHRLKAVILSGKPQRFVVRYGIDPDKRLVEGRGRSKSRTDTMHMLKPDITYRTSRSSMDTMLYGFLGDQLRPASHIRNVKPTNGELDLITDKFGDSMFESLAFVLSKEIKNVAVETNAAVLHFLMKNSTHGHKADEFFEGLATGANLDIGDPRMVIRNRLMSNRNDLRSQRNKDMMMGLIIKGWNAWNAGKTWSSREHTPDALIRIDGLDNLDGQPLYVK